MNSQTILDYLHNQFPATIGNIPLQDMLNQLQKELDDSHEAENQAHKNTKYFIRKMDNLGLGWCHPPID